MFVLTTRASLSINCCTRPHREICQQCFCTNDRGNLLAALICVNVILKLQCTSYTHNRDKCKQHFALTTWISLSMTFSTMVFFSSSSCSDSISFSISFRYQPIRSDLRRPESLSTTPEFHGDKKNICKVQNLVQQDQSQCTCSGTHAYTQAPAHTSMLYIIYSCNFKHSYEQGITTEEKKEA